MQIIFVRHGRYDEKTGLLIDDGIEDMTRSAMVVRDLYDKLHNIYKLEPFHPDDDDPNFIVPQLTYSDFAHNSTSYTGPWITFEADPTKIITSTMPRAMQSGFVMQEQLKKMGLNIDLEAGNHFFDEITNKLNMDGHGRIDRDQLPELCKLDFIQNALRYLKKLEMDGYKNVIVVTHQPNIQAFGYAICGNTQILPPHNGELMAIYSEPLKYYSNFRYCSFCQIDLENHIDDSDFSQKINDFYGEKYFNPLPIETMKEKLAAFDPKIETLSKQTTEKMKSMEEELSSIDPGILRKERLRIKAAKILEEKKNDQERQIMLSLIQLVPRVAPSPERTRAYDAVKSLLKNGMDGQQQQALLETLRKAQQNTYP